MTSGKEWETVRSAALGAQYSRQGLVRDVVTRRPVLHSREYRVAVRLVMSRAGEDLATTAP